MNFFKRKYFFQGMVQFFEEEPTICGDSVKWLDKLKIVDYSEKRASKKAFDILNKKYPEYSGFIQLF